MTEETLLDLDNFNDISMDGVEAAPEFIEPPTGRYRLGVSAKVEEYESKDDNTMKKRIRFIYSVHTVEELKDKDELVPAEGSLFSENFSISAEGLRYFKTRATAILGNLGSATLGEVITQLNDNSVDFLADVKTKKTKTTDKETKETREFTNVNVRVIGADQDLDL